MSAIAVEGIDVDNLRRDKTASRSRSVATRAALGVALSGTFVYAFLRLVNFGAAIRLLEHISVGLAVLSAVPFFAAYGLRALRWRWLLRPARVSVSMAVGIYMVGIFLNWLLPIRAGELAKSLLLKRLKGMPVAMTLPTVTMDKAMDLTPVVALIAILPFLHLAVSAPVWSLVISISVVLMAGFVVLLMAAWRREVIHRWVSRGVERLAPRRLRPGLGPFVTQFIDVLVGLMRRPKVLAVAIGLTGAAVALDALFCVLAFAAVGTSLSFTIALFGYTLFNLAYILPSAPGQIGSNEFMGLVIFAGLLGVPRRPVAAMFLFSHPWSAMLMAASAFVALSIMGVGLRDTLAILRRGAPTTEASVA